MSTLRDYSKYSVYAQIYSRRNGYKGKMIYAEKMEGKGVYINISQPVRTVTYCGVTYHSVGRTHGNLLLENLRCSNKCIKLLSDIIYTVHLNVVMESGQRYEFRSVQMDNLSVDEKTDTYNQGFLIHNMYHNNSAIWPEDVWLYEYDKKR